MSAIRTFGKRDEWAAVQLDLNVPARLDLSHDTHSCTIDHLCSSGASLGLSSPPKLGSTGYLTFVDMSVYCIVAWVDQGRCGLLFERHLAQHQMKKLIWIAENREAYELSRFQIEARTWR